MKPSHTSHHRGGFTLIETVIAIGVLAVLLTAFMLVFTPAAEGIRKSINVQQADRLASTLEQELVTFRKGNESDLPAKTPPTSPHTGFDKAFVWIQESHTETKALMVYQYRGKIGGTPRTDGTPDPVASTKDKSPGKDYAVISMVRRKGDTNFTDDLPAIEGPVYLVKCTQLVFNGGQLIANTVPGTIINPKPNTVPPDPTYNAGPFTKADDYPEAVIAFSADFYMMPAKTAGYFSSAPFSTKFPNLKNSVFTRNLAVRR